MQLLHPEDTIQVDFYPVKYWDGTISDRLIYKTVTFGINGPDPVVSKRYINRKEMNCEIDSRVHGFGYEVIDFHTDPQLYNSALNCAC